MQITNNEKQRIFHAYNAAEVVISSSVKVDKRRLGALRLGSQYVLKKYIDLSSFQLALTHIENASKEQCIEIGELLGWKNTTLVEHMGRKALTNLLSYTCELTKIESQKVVDKCREMSINIGYASYSAKDLVDLEIVTYKNKP